MRNLGFFFFATIKKIIVTIQETEAHIKTRIRKSNSRADKRIIVHFVIQAPNLAQISIMAYLFEK